MNYLFDFKIVFVVALCACTVVSMDKNHEFMEHNRRVSYEKFPCSEPQPRTVYLRDLVGENEYEKKYKYRIQNIYPTGTILHKCQNSGCCTRYNERCDALDEDDIDLTFMAIHGGSVKYFSITAQNHTFCGCQKVGEEEFIK